MLGGECLKEERSRLWQFLRERLLDVDGIVRLVESLRAQGG
jgi:hypothetical protein